MCAVAFILPSWGRCCRAVVRSVATHASQVTPDDDHVPDSPTYKNYTLASRIRGPYRPPELPVTEQGSRYAITYVVPEMTLDPTPFLDRAGAPIKNNPEKDRESIARGAMLEYYHCCKQAHRVNMFRDFGASDIVPYHMLAIGLHVWILFARLRRDGILGEDITRELGSLFWRDIENRLIGDGTKRGILVISQLKRLAKLQQSMWNGLDEGYTLGDMHLAATLWRFLTRMQGNAQDVLRLVEYVRKEHQRMDRADMVDILLGKAAFRGVP